MISLYSVQSKSRIFRWGKRLGWALLWLFTLSILAIVEENWRGRRALGAYIAEAAAKGDRLDPEAVIPPAVPDAENFAMAPLFQPLFDYTLAQDSRERPIWRNPALKKALTQMSPLPLEISTEDEPGAWRRGRYVNLAALQACYRKQADFPKSPQPQTAGEDVLLALSEFDREYAGLREADLRPQSRFPVRYQDGGRVEFPHRSFLGTLAHLPELRAVAELSLHRPDAAAQDTLLALRLADATADEPNIFSILMRDAILSEAISPVWEGLARREWSDKQLAALDAKLERVNLAAQYQLAERGERNRLLSSSLDLMKVQLRGLVKTLDFFDPHGGHSWVCAHASFLPSGWFDDNKVTMARWKDSVCSCADSAQRRFYPDRCEQVTRELDGILARNRYLPDYFYFRIVPPIELDLQKRFTWTQGSVGLARVAIALERYRLRHSSYPEALGELDAAALAKNGLPTDPATGHPAHYARTAEGRFTLYYEGWNQVDDGGVMSWMESKSAFKNQDITKGDWVWPQPSP